MNVWVENKLLKPEMEVAGALPIKLQIEAPIYDSYSWQFWSEDARSRIVSSSSKASGDTYNSGKHDPIVGLQGKLLHPARVKTKSDRNDRQSCKSAAYGYQAFLGAGRHGRQDLGGSEV